MLQLADQVKQILKRSAEDGTADMGSVMNQV
jgi:hypothetical protein